MSISRYEPAYRVKGFQNTEMRIVILVIASDELPIYAKHQACWRSYATSHPDVSVFFVRQRESVADPYIDGDTIWCSGAETLERVFDKTVAAFRLLPPSSYDYLVRTNLSSVWNFSRLLEFCATLPRQGVFCGVLGNPGLSGAGMILSPDVVKTLVDNSTTIDRGVWDDIDFGKIAERCGIPCTRGYRFDPKSRREVDLWGALGYHYYLKDMRNGVRNESNEIDVMQYLISTIYRR